MIVVMSLVFIMPFVNTTEVKADIAQIDEGVEECSTYVWVYKEVDGVKYMRLWDQLYLRWITDWIPVTE